MENDIALLNLIFLWLYFLESAFNHEQLSDDKLGVLLCLVVACAALNLKRLYLVGGNLTEILEENEGLWL